MPAHNRQHYAGTYQRQARAIRNAAQRDQTTRCWRCHRTQAEHGRRWQAGHIIDGMAGGPLAAECEECNTREGARRGNAQRNEPHSERW